VLKPGLWPALLAAIVALALVASWLFDPTPPAGIIQLDSPVLSDGHVRLAWRTAPARRYLVEVLASDNVPRFAGNAEALFLDLPGDVSTEIVRGEARVWRVTAFDEEDAVQATSSLSPLALSSAAR
jgi:hypothetical protein